MEENVYCSKCKYNKSESICLFTFWYESNYYKQRKLWASPGEKNANNDCKDFKLKWWRKLIK